MGTFYHQSTIVKALNKYSLFYWVLVIVLFLYSTPMETVTKCPTGRSFWHKVFHKVFQCYRNCYSFNMLHWRGNMKKIEPISLSTKFISVKHFNNKQLSKKFKWNKKCSVISCQRHHLILGYFYEFEAYFILVSKNKEFAWKLSFAL